MQFILLEFNVLSFQSNFFFWTPYNVFTSILCLKLFLYCAAAQEVRIVVSVHTDDHFNDVFCILKLLSKELARYNRSAIREQQAIIKLLYFFRQHSAMDIQTDLVKTWCADVLNTPLKFKQPLLDKKTSTCLKAICDSLTLTGNVFIMSVTVLEEYLYLKHSTNKKIENYIALIAGVIWICAKFMGEDENIGLDAAFIQRVIRKHWKSAKFSKKSVLRAEMNVLRTFDGKLPITNKLDDLHLFLEVFLKPLKLKVCI